MSIVLRFLFVIPIGFIAACVAASFALLWPFLERPADIDPLVFLIHSGVAFYAQMAQIGSLALLPWAAFMVVTEALALSSILLHVAAGFLAGAAVLVSAYGVAPQASVQTAIIVASLSFALVYWIVAGRRAGAWRRRSSRSPSELPEQTKD